MNSQPPQHMTRTTMLNMLAHGNLANFIWNSALMRAPDYYETYLREQPKPVTQKPSHTEEITDTAILKAIRLVRAKRNI